MQNKFAFFIAFMVGDGVDASRNAASRGKFDTGYQHRDFLAQMRKVSFRKRLR